MLSLMCFLPYVGLLVVKLLFSWLGLPAVTMTALPFSLLYIMRLCFSQIDIIFRFASSSVLFHKIDIIFVMYNKTHILSSV